MIALHVVSGWGYAPARLQPLALALAPLGPVTLHAPHEAAPRGDADTVLVGWSLGALLALASAHIAPPRALVLLAGTARFCAAEEYAPGVAGAHLRAMLAKLRRDPGRVLEDFFVRSAQPQRPDDLAADVERALALPLQTLVHGLEQLRDLDERAHVPGIGCPVLLLHGEHDAIVPADAARWLHSRLPQSKLILRPDAGHTFPLRDAAWIAARVREFLGP